MSRKELREFGHVKRFPGNILPYRILKWESEGKRRKGKPQEKRMAGERRRVTIH